METYKYKYRKYKDKYNQIKIGGASKCTSFNSKAKLCLDYPEFQDKGKNYRCSYKNNGDCYKINSKNANKIHARVRKNFPHYFNDNDDKDDNDDNDDKDDKMESLYKKIEELEGQLQDINKQQVEAQRSNNRQHIIRLMRSKPPLTKELHRLKAEYESKLENPRKECHNKLCLLDDGKTGLEEPYTKNCDKPESLIELSDHLCYDVEHQQGIKGIIQNSNTISKSFSNIPFTQIDYEKVIKNSKIGEKSTPPDISSGRMIYLQHQSQELLDDILKLQDTRYDCILAITVISNIVFHPRRGRTTQSEMDRIRNVLVYGRNISIVPPDTPPIRDPDRFDRIVEWNHLIQIRNTPTLLKEQKDKKYNEMRILVRKIINLRRVRKKILNTTFPLITQSIKYLYQHYHSITDIESNYIENDANDNTLTSKIVWIISSLQDNNPILEAIKSYGISCYDGYSSLDDTTNINEFEFFWDLYSYINILEHS